MEKSMPLIGMGFFFALEQKRANWLSPGRTLGVLDDSIPGKGSDDPIE
jgi:hypothetical protein